LAAGSSDHYCPFTDLFHRLHQNRDTHVWSLWSLDRVREVNAVYGRPQIAFSDGLVDSFYFCFQYENELVSSVWIDHLNDTVLICVADSLAEFFDVYLRDPGRIGLL